MTHAYNLKTRNPEADGSEIKGQFQLHESEASLSYDTLSQKFKVCVCVQQSSLSTHKETLLKESFKVEKGL